jgi:AcrR family transcriptional regulator
MSKPLSRPVYRLPRERRVADIMRAARTVFEDKGYDDALISEIAERAKVVEGTIYRYFENKRALLAQVAERWYADMLTDYDQGLQDIRGTWNRLRFMIWRHLVTVHQEPAMCRLVFQVLRMSEGYRDTAVFQMNRAYTRRVVDIVSEAQASGEFADDIPVRLVRDMVYGCVEHHTWAYLRGEGDFSPDDAADAITDLVYRGLATPKVTAPLSGEAYATRLADVAGRLERMTMRSRDTS